jgi:hypothetical protein
MGVDLQSAAEGVAAVSHDELTAEWRALQFARLGFENADEMARSNVDWHEAAALIAAGATPSHIARILL